MLRVRPTERDGNQVYRLDRKSMKLQLVTRQVKDRSKTVACAMAYPHDEHNWQFYRFTPRNPPQIGGDSETHLLPLPTGARRASGRFADDIMARRLEHIYTLAVGTGHLARFIIFGSFVTTKPNPGDVDIFLLNRGNKK
jgi:hypothetical protein